MAPIRRYLRITKYSVLEVRIYLDNPSLANSWLLNSRDNVLPRVIEAVRPLVLPKLREENENAAAKKKGKKKRGVRDVVGGGEFCLFFVSEREGCERDVEGRDEGEFGGKMANDVCQTNR
jgi:hypothetical protein